MDDPMEPRTAPTIPPDLPEDATFTFMPGGRHRREPLETAMPLDALPSWRGVTMAGSVGDGTSASLPDPQGEAFVLLERVGVGGMGEVWSAVQVSLGRIVAIKRLKENWESAKQRTESELDFTREAIIAARLEHPNIVPVHDLGISSDGEKLLAMKLVEGRSWKDLLKEDCAQLGSADLLARHIPILISVAQAVAFAHARGIVHRDLKPAQVMLGEFGEVLLTDWGLAIQVGDGEGDSRRAPSPVELPTAASASSPSGTPALMAPEQTEATAANIGPWTDLYQLGATLYFLLTLTFPHDAATATAAFLSASRGAVEPPTKRAPGRDIPAELAGLAMRCLEPDPRARMSSAVEFANELRDFLTGTTRRRESVALCDGVRNGMESRASYEALSDAWNSLARAGELWSSNPALPGLREEVLSRHARAAMTARDLRLARLQAERMAAGSSREGLLAEIAKAEGAVAREARSRRVAIAASFLLLVGIVVSTILFSMNIVRERDRVAKARARSDGLVKFMISDLRGSLQKLKRVDPLLRLDLLDEVAEKTLDAYEEQIAEHPEEDEAERLLDPLQELEMLTREQGNLALSQRVTDVQRSLIQPHLGSGKKPILWNTALAAVLTIEARSLIESQRDIPTAEKKANEAIAIYERVALVESSDALRRQMGTTRSLLALAAHTRGDEDTALEQYRKAIPLLERGLSAKEVSDSWRLDFARVLAGMSETLHLKKMHAESLEAVTKAGEVLDTLTEYGANDPMVVRARAIAEQRLAAAKRGLGREAEADAHFASYVEWLQAEVDANPAVIDNQRRLLLSRIDMADAHDRKGDFASAYEEMVRARESSRKLLDWNPEAANLQTDHADVLVRIAKSGFKLGKFEEAVEASQEAAGIARKRLDSDPVDPRAQSLRFSAALYGGRALFALAKSQEMLDLVDPILKETVAAMDAPTSSAKILHDNVFRLHYEKAKALMLLGDDEGAFASLADSFATGQVIDVIADDKTLLKPLKDRHPERFAEFVEGVRQKPKP